MRRPPIAVFEKIVRELGIVKSLKDFFPGLHRRLRKNQSSTLRVAAHIDFVRGEAEFAGIPMPDLAVLDLSLPRCDGLEILEAMRGSPRFATVPIVIASSSPSPPARLKEYAHRGVRYIMKPPDLEDFLQIGEVLKEILLQNQDRNAER